jgi:hypothetical protein
MGRKFKDDESPKKIVRSFCATPELLKKVDHKCIDDDISLSYLLQTFLTEWVRGELVFEKEAKPETKPKPEKKTKKEKNGKSAPTSKV